MRSLLVLSLPLLLTACDRGVEERRAGAAAGGSGEFWPTRGWRTSTPETQGLDAGPLSALDAELSSGKHGYVTGMLVVRHGHIVFERTYTHDFVRLFEGRDQRRGPYNYYDPDWHPYYRGTPVHTMQSVSKSVTSALVGVAIARGEIPDADVEMTPYFQQFRLPDDDPRRAAMRLRDVLTMRAGIEWDESSVAYTDPANSCAAMERSTDWIQYVLDRPMATQPGSTFVYNSGATQLLSYLIRKTTGKEADDYAAEHVFRPLGIEQFYWKRTPTGLADTEGGLYLTPRDLAKFGYLYLKDGTWAGQRLLPAGWVTASFAPLTDAGARGWRYGYKWWILPRQADNGRPLVAAARGYGGQYLLIVPELDLLAVFTGWNIYDRPALDPQLALERVLAAARR